jgi:hypothetical protein
LKKPVNSEEQIFWAVFAAIGIFVRWILINDKDNSNGYEVL